MILTPQERIERNRERREAPRQELLQYIYGRAGRICKNKGQKHLRDFEVVG